MPIDPSIPLSVKRAPIAPYDPQAAMARTLQMRNLQQEAIDADLKRQITLRDMADAQKIKSILGSSPDLETAIPQVTRISPKVGIDLAKTLSDQRKAKFDALKTEHEVGQQKVNHALKLVQGISDENSFATLAPLVAAASPEIAAALGPTWDTKRHGTVLQMGMTAKEAAENRGLALKQFEEGKIDLGAGRLLSTVASQPELDETIRTLKTMGVPDTVIDLYGRKWDKTYGKRAADKTMTPEERSQVAHSEERNKISWAEYQLKVKAAALSEKDVVNLSSEAITMIASQFAQTAQMPALGAGPAALNVREKIFNEAAKMYPGLQPGLVKAMYESNKAALQQITKSESVIRAFEGTAKANLKIFVKQAKKVIDTGSPYLNKPLRSFSDAVLGSPEMASYKAARQTAVAEIGKILSGSMGNAALTEGAREEVNTLMSPDSTMEQVYAAANVLIQDMENRPKYLSEQRKALLEAMQKAPIQSQSMTVSGGPGPGPVKEGTTKPIPGYPEAEQTFKGGKWVRTK